MDVTIIANRYAKALFNLAQEKNLIEPTYLDMIQVWEVVRENKSLNNILRSPIIPNPKKLSILRALFVGRISAFTFRFLELVIKKDRALLTRYIAESFVEIYKDHKNIITIQLVTAYALDELTRRKILDQLSDLTHMTIDLVEKVSPELIGGFVFSYKDRKFDASLRQKIKLLSKEFEKNPYVKEL